MKIAILIPAYKPDRKLLDLLLDINDLKEKYAIILVDDGSGDEYKSIFTSAVKTGCEILHHEKNLGKGRAIKTGIEYAQSKSIDAIITVDADGQHTAEDIKAIADAMMNASNTGLYLGVRNLKEMPLRSKAGNLLTKYLFSLLYGKKITDTQTGLRGIFKDAFQNIIELEGEQYELEMNMLIWAAKQKYPCVEIPIHTVYIDDNESSHFNPIKDGIKIYRLLFRQISFFTVSSVIGFITDYTLFAILNKIIGAGLLTSTVCARAVSSFVNYSINRYFVFEKGTRSLLKYYMLVLLILTLNYGLMYVMVNMFMVNSLIAKPIVELFLYFVSYKFQLNLVFSKQCVSNEKDCKINSKSEKQ